MLCRYFLRPIQGDKAGEAGEAFSPDPGKSINATITTAFGNVKE